MDFLKYVFMVTVTILLSAWVVHPTQAVTNHHFQVSENVFQKPSCPCSDPQLCESIKDVTRKEVFAFALDNAPDHFQLFDWSKLTTVVMFGWINLDLMCLAHSKGVRVVKLASVDEETFMSPELRKQWIGDQLNATKSNFLDGVNFDFESEVDQDQADVRDAYTALVRETNEAFKKELPYSQVTVDVAWMPNTDSRYYDYVGLAEGSDFLFVMAYDEQSQIFGDCVAGPNSNFRWALEGLSTYMKELREDIPANKLVLGVPWYGYKYTCIDLDEDTCYIEEVPFRGVNCSDAAGTQHAYNKIYDVVKEQVPMWNATSSTPFFTYYDESTNETIQYQYDDPLSLSMKYDLAAELDIRGVGMWNIDYLDYSDTQEGVDMRKAMFGALPNRTDELGSEVIGGSKAGTVTQKDSGTVILNDDSTKSIKPYSGAPACPCSDPKLCEPIKDMNRKEIFAFSQVDDESHWQKFDWSKLTTVVMFNYINTDLMCLAHSYGVRAVMNGVLLDLIMIIPELRDLWIQEQAQIVRDNFLDGFDFDYEYTVYPSEHYYIDAFTETVRDTMAALRADNPYAQISVCTVYTATTQLKVYDFAALAEIADFLFMMDYDESATFQNGPNSDYYWTQQGVQSFLNLNISAEKLVLGLPWYGDCYQCVTLEGDNCVIEPDGTGFAQWWYARIMEVLDTMPDRYRWNETSLTPYFTFMDENTNTSHIVQYDNPRSLSLKYQLAIDMGLRGVGMWHIDALDYSDTEYGESMRQEMFGALPVWNNSRVEKTIGKSDKHHQGSFVSSSSNSFQHSSSSSLASSNEDKLKGIIRYSQSKHDANHVSQLSSSQQIWESGRVHESPEIKPKESKIIKFKSEKEV